MALVSTQSWAIMNAAASNLPIEISLELESPVVIEQSDESVEFFFDFSRKRTRHLWTIWLSSPKGVRRKRGASVLQLEALPAAEPENELTADVMQIFCKQHLELLLRLAKSDRFWIEEWKHRGYLLSKYSSDARTYRIDQDIPTLVRLLNDKLRDFFWDQWMLRRLQEPEEGVRKRARHSVADWQRVLNRKKEIVASTHYIQTALSYYSKALAETPSERDQVIIEVMIALEALITDEEEKSEIQYKLARRVASLVGNDPYSMKQSFDLLKRFYDLRSKIVHGSTKAEVLGKDLKSEIPKLVEFARICLLYLLALRDIPKNQILASLDYGTFDLHELEVVKSKTRSFWGKENWPKLVRSVG